MPTLTIPKCQSALSPAVRRVIHSSNFKRWFGDSKVVDDKGQPLVVYHGTGFPKAIVEFDGSAIAGWFSEDPALCLRYMAAGGYDWETGQELDSAPSIYPVYLRMARPFDFRKLGLRAEDKAPLQRLSLTFGCPVYGHSQDALLYEYYGCQDFVDWLCREGYDGVVVEETNPADRIPRGTLTFGALFPAQIKSVFNCGRFNAESTSILE